MNGLIPKIRPTLWHLANNEKDNKDSEQRIQTRRQKSMYPNCRAIDNGISVHGSKIP